MVAELPEQIVELVPALAAGNAFTVIVTGFEFEQPVAVIFSVSVYTVVTNGATVFEDTVDVNPEGLLVHE